MDLAIDFLFIGIGVGAGYAVLGVSFSLIYRLTGILHFAHGAVFAIAAMLFVELTASDGTPTIVALIASIGAAAIIGALIYRIFYRPLERRRVSLLSTFVTSLGLLIVGEAALALLFGENEQVGTVGTGLAAPIFRSGAIIVRGIDVLGVGIAAVVLLALALVWKRTRVGVVLQALEANRGLAEDLNVPYERFALIAFGAGSALCGVSAVVYSLSLTVDPYVGTAMLLNAFIAMVIGGTGSIWASAVGGVVLGIVDSVPQAWISPSWIDAVSFGLLLVVLVAAPRGIVNLRLPRRTDKRTRLAGAASGVSEGS